MKINLNALEQFRLVVAAGGFTQAAEILGVAQPAISMNIKKLEESLGMRLLDRDARPQKLTSEGEVLLQHAETIHLAVENAEREMAAIAGLSRGEVRIGIPSMLGSYYFPPLLMAFRQAYPELQLRIIEAGTRSLQQMLDSGEIDIGVIVADPLPQHLKTLHILRDQMMVILPQDHPLAELESVSTDAFLQEDLVLFQSGYFHREVVDRLSKDAGVKPKITVETALLPLIKQLVGRGFAISTLLERVISEDKNLIARPFDTPVWLDICIAWHPERRLTKANQAFVDFVAQQIDIA